MPGLACKRSIENIERSSSFVFFVFVFVFIFGISASQHQHQHRHRRFLPLYTSELSPADWSTGASSAAVQVPPASQFTGCVDAPLICSFYDCWERDRVTAHHIMATKAATKRVSLYMIYHGRPINGHANGKSRILAHPRVPKHPKEPTSIHCCTSVRVQHTRVRL